MNIKELHEQITDGRKLLGKSPQAVIRVGEVYFSISAVKVKGGKIPLLIVEAKNVSPR